MFDGLGAFSYPHSQTGQVLFTNPAGTTHQLTALGSQHKLGDALPQACVLVCHVGIRYRPRRLKFHSPWAGIVNGVISD